MPQSNFGQQYFGSSAKGSSSYGRRPTSSKGMDSSSAGIERQQPFSQQYNPSQAGRSSSHQGSKGPEPRPYVPSYKGGLGYKEPNTHSTSSFNAPPKMDSIQNVVQNAQKLVDGIGK